jgi:hypothetical protein
LVERLHGMQEVREFDSPRLHHLTGTFSAGAGQIFWYRSNNWSNRAHQAQLPEQLAVGLGVLRPTEQVLHDHQNGVDGRLARLREQGIVLSERAGNAYLYRFNRDHLAAG